jgi:threonine synthase
MSLHTGNHIKDITKQKPGGYPLHKVIGFQTADSAPIVKERPIAKLETIATTIIVGSVQPRERPSKKQEMNPAGVIGKVTYEEILEAHRIVTATEDVFCEPVSTSSTAGLIKYIKLGYFKNTNPVKLTTCLPDTA